MKRKMIYPGQIPLETDLLQTNKNVMVAIAKLAAAILGTNTLVNGLAVVPDTPASLNVSVGAGEIYSLQNIDATAYSSIAADTTHAIVKQGINLDAVLLNCPAPATAGQSINYLIQAIFQETDTTPVTLPYYNASNPSQAWSGPNNTGTQQMTSRDGVCTVSAKAGISAATGSQTTPAPDVGYVGLMVVTVANGQTTITAPNIAAYPGSPTIPSAGILAGAVQGGVCNTSAGGGTADAITGSFFPGIATLVNGMTVNVRATAANATTTPTFTPNSGTIGAKTIVKGANGALVAGDISGAGFWMTLKYDATLDKWVMQNPAKGVSSGIQFYTIATVPTTNVGQDAIIVTDGGGMWEWVSTAYFTGYRHPESFDRMDGRMTGTPKAFEVDAVGGNMSKTSTIGARIWARAQEEGKTVALGSWAAGNHHVADNGDGTFRLPDLRMTFSRMSAGATDLDTANAITSGKYKADTTKSHGHGVNDPSHGHAYPNGGAGGGGYAVLSNGYGGDAGVYPAFTGISIAASGTAETAPRHTAYFARIHG